MIAAPYAWPLPKIARDFAIPFLRDRDTSHLGTASGQAQYGTPDTNACARSVIRSLALIVDTNEIRRAALVNAVASTDCRVGAPVDLGTIAMGTHEPPTLVVIGVSRHQASVAWSAIGRLRERDRRLPVIVVTDEGSEEIAVAALRAGVKDYFCEPIDWARFTDRLRRCLGERDRNGAPPRIHAGTPSTSWIGRSSSMRRVSEYLARAARYDATVLITGETGTGKELAASFIHERSPRCHAKLVSVNCAAIPEGLLESELFGHEKGAFTGAVGRRIGMLEAANGGTVFLDEIADMSLSGQAKLLRVIESREVHPVGGKRPERLDVRFVAATNQDLERAVDEGRFRKDLFYRLAVACVRLPPLRERRSDIGALLEHFLARLKPESTAATPTLADETRETLEEYDWPGNVRELRNLVEAMFLAPPARPITLADLPEAFRDRLRRTDGSGERRRLVEALRATNWNKSRAAQILHWSRMTVYRKMTKYSLDALPPSPNERAG